jgi:hypothetical protein
MFSDVCRKLKKVENHWPRGYRLSMLAATEDKNYEVRCNTFAVSQCVLEFENENGRRMRKREVATQLKILIKY